MVRSTRTKHSSGKKKFRPPPLRPARNDTAAAGTSAASTSESDSTRLTRTPPSSPRRAPHAPHRADVLGESDDETWSASSGSEAAHDGDEAFFAGWRRGARIGRGAFGEVFMGLNVDSGALFAEKVIELEFDDAAPPAVLQPDADADDASPAALPHAHAHSHAHPHVHPHPHAHPHHHELPPAELPSATSDEAAVLGLDVGGVIGGGGGGGGGGVGGADEIEPADELIEADADVQAQIDEARREIDLMRQLSHEHIVQYLGTRVRRRQLSIFLEYISGGSIHSLLKRFGPFPLKLVANYTRQTLSGLAYLHARQVIHRDIKGANLLVTERGVVKLADFGCSKNTLSTLSIRRRRRIESGDNGNDNAALSADETAMRGTPNFMAPEVITRSAFRPASDVWSVGATVLEMATGRAPFAGGHRDESIATVLFRVASLSAPPRAEYPPHVLADADFGALLDSCFAIDPSLRATAAALVTFLDERGLVPPAAVIHPAKRL